MVIGRNAVFGCAANFLRGRKCVFCGSFKVIHTRRGYIKCRGCGKSKSMSRLRREISILQGFYQQQPAYRLAGEIELDESYFGGRRKGVRGRGAKGKSIVFGLLEREGRVYTKVVENVTAETLMQHIAARTRKGSVYYTDAFRGYQSLKRYGKHHVVNHQKQLVDKRTKNHINGIEGFWSYAKHILYNYRGVSKYHFPMYLKEIEYRYNHRGENVFKLFLKLYFGYVSP